MAMQGMNILRDIDEDAAAGRIYLPPATIARYCSLAPGRRAGLVRDEIARADAPYERGIAGITELRQGRWAIAAVAMYPEILPEIARRGFGASPGRAQVSRSRRLAGGAWAAARA
jgi:15-cis-phytoene synthase